MLLLLLYLQIFRYFFLSHSTLRTLKPIYIISKCVVNRCLSVENTESS